MTISSLRDKYLAAFLMQPGSVQLRDVPTPKPNRGELLLRVDCALAGGTDRKAFLRGHPQIPMPGPFGHRYAGTVVDKGSEAPFQVGQAVMGVHSAPCGHCHLCRKNRQNLCPDVMKEKVMGSFAEYLRIPAAIANCNVFERPAELHARHAAFLEPLACVVHALESLDFRGVERIAILGLGAMGLLFAQVLPLYTDALVFASGHRHFDRTAKLAIKQTWDTSTKPLADQISAADHFDCVIECTGQTSGWQDAVQCAAPGAQILFFGGLPRGTTFAIDTFRLHYEDLRLLGCFHFSPADVVKARDLLITQQWNFDMLISDTLPLTKIDIALQRLAAGEGIQYVIEPHG